MALPTPTDLKTLDYAFAAQPFCQVASKTSITLLGMDYAFEAQPFVTQDPMGGWTGKLNRVTSIGKINRMSLASISKVNRVA